MMLHTDYCLVVDPVFKKHVEKYAQNEAAFLKDFSSACEKLFNLGVPFKERHGIGFWGGLIKSPPEVVY